MPRTNIVDDPYEISAIKELQEMYKYFQDNGDYSNCKLLMGVFCVLNKHLTTSTGWRIQFDGSIADELINPLIEPDVKEEYIIEDDHYCEECEYCKQGIRYVREPVIREADNKVVIKNTDKPCYAYFCVKDVENIKEVYSTDKVCEEHGELWEEEG